jgi:hypothetical protein
MRNHFHPNVGHIHPNVGDFIQFMVCVGGGGGFIHEMELMQDIPISLCRITNQQQ